MRTAWGVGAEEVGKGRVAVRLSFQLEHFPFCTCERFSGKYASAHHLRSCPYNPAKIIRLYTYFVRYWHAHTQTHIIMLARCGLKKEAMWVIVHHKIANEINNCVDGRLTGWQIEWETRTGGIYCIIEMLLQFHRIFDMDVWCVAMWRMGLNVKGYY